MSVYVNEIIRVYYAALKYTTGLTDVKLKVRKPDGSTEGIFTLIEALPDFPGTYYYDYTPNTKGNYLFEVGSVINGHKFSKKYNVVDEPLVELKPSIVFE